MKMRDIITLVEGKVFESLEPTNRYNQQILDFLAKEGIKTYDFEGIVAIDRTSMVQYAKGLDENDSYTYVLELIKEQLPNNLMVMWAGRNDDWMGIDVYERNFSR